MPIGPAFYCGDWFLIAKRTMCMEHFTVSFKQKLGFIGFSPHLGLPSPMLKRHSLFPLFFTKHSNSSHFLFNSIKVRMLMQTFNAKIFQCLLSNCYLYVCKTCDVLLANALYFVYTCLYLSICLYKLVSFY